jgi:hypothetical protein
MQVNQEKKLLELYTQFLMVSTGQISNTVLSSLLDKEVSHDSFTRLLSHKEYSSTDLWKLGKSYVRSVECEEGVLILDDHIEAKPYMDENDLICWHYDHTVGKSVKGINQMSMLYYANDCSIPVGFRFIHKTETVVDPKTGKDKRISKITKNEHYRNLLKEAELHQIKYKYVLNDSWFCSAENIVFIHEDLKKHFVMPIKENRNIALSEKDKKNGVYIKLNSIDLSDNKLVEVWLEGVEFPLHLTKQVFKNKDDSEGFIYLITDDLSIDSTQIHTIYKKRWKVEEHHKTIKSNLNYSKSPAHNAKTQANHCFAVLYAAIQWEKLSKNVGLNHFALKAKLYLNALKTAWKELVALKGGITITNNPA